MPKVKISKTPKKGQFIPSYDSLGEEIRGTSSKMDMGGSMPRMHFPQMDGNMYEDGGPTNGVFYGDEQSDYMKKGGWMKGAVNPKHKGYCTPMTKSTCTGHRRAFAETMKKHHGFHEQGGYIPEFKLGGPNLDFNPNKNGAGPDYNPYVYFKDKNWYMSSNPEDASITGSIKPIDRSAANIEAEKGEYLVKPGLTGLYKITGEKHSAGGTPLYAEGGSFIFSNDPKLAINKNEREGFGFKPGSSTSKSKNTPAQVLSREVKPKDYNSYIATLEDDKTDKIAKTTAALMLEKLQQKLGQIAYLQENKKQGDIPDFAKGTAPVNQPQFDQIDEKMSEFNYGGMYPYGGGVDPYDPPIDPNDQYPGGRTKLGKITPKGLANNFNYPGGVPNLIKDWKGVGVDLSNMDSGQAQGAMYDWAMKNNPNALRNVWSTYGNTTQGQNKGLNYDYDNLNDNQLASARNSYTDGMLGARVFAPGTNHIPQSPGLPPLANTYNPPNVQMPPPGAPPQMQMPGQPTTTLPYQIKGKLTDNQLSHLGYLGLQSLNINRYYPKREQVTLPNVKLDQINSQPYVNQINNQAYESRELAAINPRTASLVGSNIRGATVDQLSQTLGNINNQNTQIGNQQNLTNLQQKSQQVMANSQFDNTYYNQVQATNQNFDNERRFANNQFMSTLNGYQSQADQLAWGLAAVNKYGVRKVTDPKTGKTYDLPTPLYEVDQRSGRINYNADVANLNMATNANRINTPGELASTYQQFKAAGIPDVEAQRLISAMIRARGNSTTGQGPFFSQNPYGQ